jgi:hypothetical protein
MSKERTSQAMKLPRNLEAIVSERKLTGYLLSETHSVGRTKAKYFRALGYNEGNLVRLKEALIAVAVTSDVIESISIPFGTKYVVDGDLDAPTGIRARVRTVWILESGEDFPRFVTAYPIGAEDRGAESD